MFANTFKYIIGALCLVFTCTLSAQSTVTCPTCDGSGKVTKRCGHCHNGAIFCETCNYTGKIKERCYECDNGYIETTVKKRCTQCNHGYVRVNRPTPCSCRGGKRPQKGPGGQTVYVTCNRCNGRGQLDNYVSERCSYCGGSGYSGTETKREKHHCNYGWIEKTCGECNGKRSYLCSHCQGYANVSTTCDRCRGNGRIYVYSGQ